MKILQSSISEVDFPIHQPVISQVERADIVLSTKRISSDGRLNSCLQAGRILKMFKYTALVLLCNLAISVLGEFDAEEPLDRGRYCLGLKAMRRKI